MTEKLRVGFIGLGRIADMHYEGYRNNPRASLDAVCDVDPAIDAVEIITPHHLHAEMSIAALEAGKHVSVQKPMAMNVTEADAMLAAADRSDRLFRVIENYRFSPLFAKAREMLRAGEIGEPLTLRIKSLTGNMRHGWDVPSNAQDWRSDEARSGQGSTVFDHGQHIWSIARYLMGDVERTFAFIGREQAQAHHELTPGSFLENPAMASWKYRGAERYGSWESVYAEEMVIRSRYYPIYVSMEATGTRGVLWVNNFIGQRLDNRTPLEMYRDGKIVALRGRRPGLRHQLLPRRARLHRRRAGGAGHGNDRHRGPRGAALLHRGPSIRQGGPRSPPRRDHGLAGRRTLVSSGSALPAIQGALLGVVVVVELRGAGHGRRCSAEPRRRRSLASMSGTSVWTMSQTTSSSMPRYPCATRFRVATMRRHSICGCSSRTCLGTCVAASPISSMLRSVAS